MAIAEEYRDYGLRRGYINDETRYGDTVITLKDGQTFSYMHSEELSRNNPSLYRALYQLAYYFEHTPDATGEDALNAVRSDYERLIKKNSRKRSEKIFVAQLRSDFNAFKSITDVSHKKSSDLKHGNIYEFDIPENEDLLNWDALLSEQSPKVKKNIRKLYAALKNMGIPKKELVYYLPGGRKLETGEDLYEAVRGIMGEYLENNPNPEDGIIRADARASMIFNEAGIPGLRYIDVFDRNASTGVYTPHSFVIWNMDKMQMLGLTPDSDEDAREYYERTQQNSETYHQTINYSITMKDGSVFSSSNSPFDTITGDEALNMFNNGIKDILNSAKFDKKNLNAKYFLDTLRAGYLKGIETLFRKIEDDEKAIEQVEDDELKAAVKDMLKTTHSLTKARIKNFKAALQVIDNISDIQFTEVVPAQPKALSLQDILNDTPKGTFEEGLAEPLSKKARKQMEAVYKKYHGTEQWLKAPNGKKSNLTERQWLAVRTPLFKSWFGDWENDPENASKVLDENGEPLVVYHGSPNAGFSEFDTSGEGNSADTGAWFTSSRENAGSYTSDYEDVYAVFLNIRNPYIIDGYKRSWNELGDISIYDRETGYGIYSKDNGEPFTSRKDAEDYIANIIGYDPDEDPNRDIVDDEGDHYYNPDFEERYVVEIEEEYSHTNEIVRAIFNGDIYAGGDVDGVIFKDIYDTGGHAAASILSDVFVVPTANNIKSATGNNGNYSEAENIYHQLIGVDGASRLDEAEGTTTRMDLLNWAKYLENIGIPAGKIWYATSWARGKDKKWRYELPYGRVIDRYKFRDKDGKRRLHLAMKSVIGTLTPKEEKHLERLQFAIDGVSLADVFDAPELFNAYPELRAIKYQEREFDDDTLGLFNPITKTIIVETRLNNSALRETLIHEIQHVIQDIEGFAAGSSFDLKTDEVYKRRKAKIDKLLSSLDKSIRDDWEDAIDKLNVQKITQLYREGISRSGTDKAQRKIYNNLLALYEGIVNREGKLARRYYRSAGEVEARNASKRSTIPEEMRRRFIPAADEDVPRDKQIVGKRMRKLSLSADTYHQNTQTTAAYTDDAILTPEAQSQMDAVRRKYFGTKQWLKAPNGKDTKLTEKQWLQVRTENFKKWFGDWELDPANASKVLDENGEPLIVYHGTTVPVDNIRIFERGTVGWLGPGIYLTPFIEYARQFSDKGDAGVMALFLNLRSPLQLNETWRIGRPYLELLQKLYGDRANAIYKERYDAVAEKDKDILAEMPNEARRRQYIHRRIVTGEEVQQLLSQGYDGINWDDGEYVVLDPNQVKSATRNNGEYSEAPEIYKQKAINPNDFTLSPEAKRQMAEVRKQYEGTSQWLKAPNGKPTNLTEHQWLAVRTPNFINWFGDWLNDPTNASKILDENGEPLVVWHGTQKGGFSIFDTQGRNHSKGAGAFFNDNKNIAVTYIRGKLSEDKLYPVFLNVRTPYVMDANSKSWIALQECHIFDSLKGRNILVKKDGSNFTSKDDAADYIRRVLHDPNNKRFSVAESDYMTTDEIARFVWKLKKGGARRYDGIIINNIIDIGSVTAEALDVISNDFIAITPTQIKSATRNNGAYSTTDPNQYHQATKRSLIKERINGFFNTQDTFIGMDGKGQQQTISIPEQQIEAIRKQYEGTSQWMRAPDGKPTNLTEKQWLQVRTPNFKRWFGDWENDPENASKVLDEHGEPLVVIHIARKGEGYSIFNTNGDFSLDGGKTTNTGAWFADFKGKEQEVAENTGHSIDIEGKNIYHVFLNLRNPFIYDAEGKRWQRVGKVWIENDNGEAIYYDDYAGRVFSNLRQAQGYIKHNFGDNSSYHVMHTDFQTSDELVRGVREGIIGDGNHDGVIIRNLRDMSVWGVDDYVVFDAENIKSAISNNGNFDPTDPDIYHQAVRRDNEKRERKLTQKAQKVAKKIGRFGQDTIEQYFQRWDRTPATDEAVQRLLERNRHAEPAFRRLMSEIQQELGGELITRKQMKSPERIIVKANRAFGGNVSKVGDVWAATLVFDTEDELLDAIIKFRKRNDIVHQANRWSKPKRSSGYRDFEAHLALDDGTVVELQLQHRGIQEVKDSIGHSLYEFSTNNMYDYALSDYTWEAGNISKRLYAAALDGSYRALSQSDKNTLRRLGETLAQAEDPDEAEQAINALQKFIDDKLPKGVTEDRTAPADRHSPELDPIAAQYLYETADSVVLPLDVLIQSKQVDARSVSRARRNMHSALNGYKSPRKPLTARSNGDGTYYLIDGNDTYAVLRELGAKNAPVTLIGGRPYDGQPDTYRNASSREQASQASVRYDAVSSSTSTRDLSGASRYTRPDGIKSSGMSSSPARYSTANGAPSLLMKYSNILNNSNPDGIDIDNLTTDNEGFISDETMERYNQPSYQGTGHIIIGNRMDLSKIGTGEGHQAFGWGIYSAQLKEVAETYRLHGVPNLGLGTIHIHTDDGAIYSADNLDNWDKDMPKHIRWGLNYFMQTACWRQKAAQDSGIAPNLENIKSLAKYKLEKFDGHDKQGRFIMGWKAIVHKAIDFIETINSFNLLQTAIQGKKDIFIC